MRMARTMAQFGRVGEMGTVCRVREGPLSVRRGRPCRMPPIAQIRGLLFDKDGTLLDFNRTWFDVVMRPSRRPLPRRHAPASWSRPVAMTGARDGSAAARWSRRERWPIRRSLASARLDAERAAQVETFERLALHPCPAQSQCPGIAGNTRNPRIGLISPGIATNDPEAGAAIGRGAGVRRAVRRGDRLRLSCSGRKSFPGPVAAVCVPEGLRPPRSR